MSDNSLGFIIFYIMFYLGVSFIGVAAASGLGASGDASAVPVLTATPGVLDYLIFVFDNLAFFFGLQGLTIFGLPAAYAVFLSVPLSAGMLYSLLRLIRGGG